MYGDFSRNPFSQTTHITRVLFNQGQPLVEADLNEALNAVVSNAGYICDSDVYPLKYGITSDSVILNCGDIKTPVGGFKIGCPILLPFPDPRPKEFFLEVSQHPLSLAYIKRRLADERLAHASEIWGLRLRIVGAISKMLPQVRCYFSCQSSKADVLPRHSIIRIEVHSIVTDSAKLPSAENLNKNGEDPQENNQLVFKMDLHNAGYANSVCKIQDNTITLHRNSCFVRNIAQGELVELQSPTTDEFISYSADCARSLHVIESVNDRDAVLQDKPPTWHDELQCRFWFESAGLDKQVPNQVSFGKSGVTMSFTGDPGQFRPGMFWLISSDELKAAANQSASICESSNFPEQYYSLNLESSACDTPTGPETAPAPLPPAEAPTPKLPAMPPPPVCAHPSSLNWHDLPCGALAVDANSAAMRRWLASMTLGELAGLDHEQVRARLTRDCNIRLEADPDLESEILKLIARRDQYLGASCSQLA